MRGAACGVPQEGAGFVHDDLPALVQDEGRIGQGDDLRDGVGHVEHGDGEFAVDSLEVAQDTAPDAQME